MQKTLFQIIHETTMKKPDSLCVIDSYGVHSYRDLWDNIENFIYGIQEINHISKGSRVLVECTQDMEYLAFIFACNYCEIVYIPIEHKTSNNRIIQIYTDSKADLYVSRSNLHNNSILNMSYKEIYRHMTNRIDNWIYPELSSVSEILYTTGTTGESKGIILTNLNNIAIAENIVYGTKMKKGNREFIPLPISHSHGLRACYANLYREGCVFLTEGVSNISLIFDTIKKYNITSMDLSPTAMRFLLKMSKGQFAEFNCQFDFIQIGTSMLTEELKNSMKQIFKDVRLYNFYGSTESGRSSVLNFNSCEDREFCIGRATKHATFIVTDDEHNIINSSINNTGILACAGKMNMQGYLNQPKLTESVMQNGYVYSNDEAYIDNDGLIYVIGRRDDIINYKGIKISPTEIEGIIIKYDQVVDCACVPMKDDNAGQVPVLFIEVDEEIKFDKTDFYLYMNDNIDGNKIPKAIKIIEKIPRTYNGKIKRKELAEKL